jgi:hypothetical protein
VEVFVSYAVRGFVEELREQPANYVHERFQGAPTPARMAAF